jgi:hypothetical protein
MTELLPPTHITRASLAGPPGRHPSGRILAAASTPLHLAVGAAGGTLSGARVRGLLFGTGLWAGAYAGLLPAIGLMPRPSATSAAGRPRW